MGGCSEPAALEPTGVLLLLGGEGGMTAAGAHGWLFWSSECESAGGLLTVGLDGAAVVVRKGEEEDELVRRHGNNKDHLEEDRRCGCSCCDVDCTTADGDGVMVFGIVVVVVVVGTVVVVVVVIVEERRVRRRPLRRG